MYKIIMHMTEIVFCTENIYTVTEMESQYDEITLDCCIGYESSADKS